MGNEHFNGFVDPSGEAKCAPGHSPLGACGGAVPFGVGGGGGRGGGFGSGGGAAGAGSRGGGGFVGPVVGGAAGATIGLCFHYPERCASFVEEAERGGVCDPNIIQENFGIEETKTLGECLNRCELGVEGREALCRSLRNTRLQALCWEKVLLGVTECRGFCFNNF